MWRYSMFIDWKTIVKLAKFSKLIDRFNQVHIKISPAFSPFLELTNWFLNIKIQETQIHTILKRNKVKRLTLLHFKNYYSKYTARQCGSGINTDIPIKRKKLRVQSYNLHISRHLIKGAKIIPKGKNHLVNK